MQSDREFAAGIQPRIGSAVGTYPRNVIHNAARSSRDDEPDERQPVFEPFPIGLERQYEDAFDRGELGYLKLNMALQDSYKAIRIVCKCAVQAAARLQRKYQILSGIECRYAGCVIFEEVYPCTPLTLGMDILQFDWTINVGPRRQSVSTWTRHHI